MKYRIFITLASFAFLWNCSKNSQRDYSTSTDKKFLLSESKRIDKQIDSLHAIQKIIQQRLNELDPQNKKLAVRTQTAKFTVFKHFIEMQASVETDENVVVSPQFQGTLTLFVKKGQRVGAGQVIGKVNDGGLAQQLKQAQIQSDLAKIAYEKQKRLWDQKIGSEIQYLQAKTQYEASLKAVASIRDQLARTTITAPFSGVVDEIITLSGQTVMPGMQILKLVNLSHMKVVVNLPEVYLPTIKLGMPVEVRLDALNRDITSRISFIGNSINPNNRTFQVEIPVPNPDGLVKPNLIAKVKIVDYLNPNAIVVPPNAIRQLTDGSFVVFKVVKSDRSFVAKSAVIEKGKTSKQGVEIKSGLNANDEFISELNDLIQDGSELIIEN